MTATRPGCTTPDGTSLDAATTAVLICEAHLQPVITDTSGNPLNLGRTVRLFTPAQKQALVVRDGGCVFPGCDQPASRCDAHHETPWTQGGRTDIDDGALLCRRHHGLMHCDRPWTLLRYDIADLPAHLAEAHRQRATSANLDPTTQVKVFRDPHGKLLLAQNTTDHQGPAPP
ncbi:MAG: HNH endonuclease [Microthrixaceae bacterium]|nr:HNH endonuclease [Microthrixaceae bacterium]